VTEATFHEVSPWIERPPDVTSPLQGDLQSDVVIVGGGCTGLSAALALRDEGADVVVLEREFAGSGASGRNAGHLTPTIGKDLPTVLRMFGRDRGAALLRFADEAVAYTESLIQKYGIECEYLPSGNIMAGVHPKQEGKLKRAAEAGAQLGSRVRFLPEGEMRERGLPPAFCSGVLEEKGGTLNPGLYVLGLRRAALAAGVRLYEQTAVEEIEDARPVRVFSKGGSVRAEKAIIATNAYTPGLGWKDRAVIPLRVSLFETEPLTEGDRAALGWPGREGIYTAHEALENYRLTAQGTLSGGSKVVRYAFGSKLAPGYDPTSFSSIESAFRERFPCLRAGSIAHFWGGWIALPLDFLPSVGVLGKERNVFYGLGYAGHGMAQASLAGRMLADLIQGREHRCLTALARRTRNWPPEPLRWLGFWALNGLIGGIDARTDRQIRRARANCSTIAG
jgi:glycine/D-amino acid oxidase-like deaminating enzyme